MASRSVKEEALAMAEDEEDMVNAGPLGEGEDEEEIPQASILVEMQDISQAAAPAAQDAPLLTREQKKARDAERARLRYANLTPEQKRARNDRTMLLQRRRKIRQREMNELEEILYASGDMFHDEGVVERFSRLNKALQQFSEQTAVLPEQPIKKEAFLYGYAEEQQTEEEAALQIRIERKRLASRSRYHRMTPEEKSEFNRKRSERWHQRRQEDLELLSTPPEELTEEMLEKIREIKEARLRRSQLALQRYYRMTPQERKAYNAKRTRSSKYLSDRVRNNNAEDGAQEEAEEEVMDFKDVAMIKEENPLIDATAASLNEYIYDIPKPAENGYWFDFL